ncbi:hypothetical protein [Zobellia barbeyronii]|uniref:Uncharacterized protein n=1 Tax=Zobellia barbeyronii TaxID=2748009 RepID=A0ABS5W9W1_9FLAO|nr:hypothetical protein [Zobellia barbeyronii]MBT2160201.1 hypothetical protein [Zobellia barbeyronii]
MKLKHISLFNLIEIFSRPTRQLQTVDVQTHCEQKHHHDFYCDAQQSHPKF